MSQITVGSIQNLAGDGAASLYEGVAKSWVEFIGTGTAALSASHNLSSLTDNGTGDYTMNLTSAMASAAYAAISSGSSMHTKTVTSSASAYDITTYDTAHASSDTSVGCADAYGDLA